MNEIKCPKCGTIFQISEQDYDSILKQVRNEEFDKELKIREEVAKKEQEAAIKLTENAVSKKFSDEINKRELEIQELRNELKTKELESKLAINKALEEENEKIYELKNKIESNQNEYLLKEKTLISSYEDKIKTRDEQIAYYKDFKAKQSTKMIGESLEQHCSILFNRIRPMFGSKTYFEKDNDSKTGSKGDFIFRDYDKDGEEIVSIMFEMKNEADMTATKHKNEDFLKELDKDRKEKKCEYAVLVSLLEIDNALYNDGIVDMSHKYEKMYVIRPQFFIPIITLIRNLSLNCLDYKRKLALVENQHIDISNFEKNINTFKEGFGRNYRLASEKFAKAIEEIDKTIDHLYKTKDALINSENQLRLANNKIDDLTIKKLTHGNETMTKMFEELKESHD
ncbi:MAG: DUF2130 domain-containing protein [Acholeplasma sp.]|jgi:hypothetical protein|nr:DUF2130 domain-containing protein [Acholeplasma sp.]CCY28639.1 putative uncharacterized protein [Acholeplasma sp. CAG:878]